MNLGKCAFIKELLRPELQFKLASCLSQPIEETHTHTLSQFKMTTLFQYITLLYVDCKNVSEPIRLLDLRSMFYDITLYDNLTFVTQSLTSI